MPKVEQTADSKIKISLENGPEIFTANDPLEATNQLATALDEGKKWGREGWAKAKQYEAELAAAKQTTTPTPVADPNEKQLQEYLLNQTAKALGYNSADEYKADLGRVKGTVDEVAKSQALQSFFSQHPEFPGTPEANDAIGKIFDEMGWQDMTAQNLHLAHLEAVNRHSKDPKQGYEPLSAEAVNSAWANNMSAASRQAAPPMLRTNNPEITAGGGGDPYAVPMADLRKMAIQQQLEGKR